MIRGLVYVEAMVSGMDQVERSIQGAICTFPVRDLYCFFEKV